MGRCTVGRMQVESGMAVATKDYIGRILSGYRLIALLGSGGAGAVFLGERLDDTSIQRAIKVLLPGDALPSTELASFQARFLREAQAASQLRHPHILPILSYHAETSGLSYMELPLMRGGTLASRIATGPIPLDGVADYLRQIASALDYAHGQGVIHRDVKAVNVLLDSDGEAYLADFGIARIFEHGTQPLDTGNATPLTQTGQIIGTPAGMAPEQFTGGAITPQVDIYALGVLAWQLVTGSVPFVASDALQLALQHLNNPVPSARALRPELPEPADMALRKALAKRPQDRFATAGAFATAFMDGLHGEWNPALTEPATADETSDATLAESGAMPGMLGALAAGDAINLDSRTRLATRKTRKLPENQPRRHLGRTILIAMTVLALMSSGVVLVSRVAPSMSLFAQRAPTAAPSPSPSPSPTPVSSAAQVAAGNLLYTTNTPGLCDTLGATWIMNKFGQQQCGGNEMTLSGADCPCPLALVKLQNLPHGAFPDSYVIQAHMQSIGPRRTDFFGFKFREQAKTGSPTNFGGYGFLVDANGEWQFNSYEPGGARVTVKTGELPNTLQGPHIFDLTVSGSTFTFAIDGRVIDTEHDSTYSGGIVDFAVEPGGVIFITGVALYALPS
jgi:serine/threonine protein kinase